VEKIAIIDLGSNSARVVIAKVLDGGHYVVIDELKETVRLSQDMERDGYIKTQRIEETVKTLKIFKKLCSAHNTNNIIAVATAAVRRAKNQKSFLEEVSATVGIKFRVLSADEESQAVYNGVVNSMDIHKGLIMEIGGGSTKIIYYNRRSILNFETLPFGAVTLNEIFSKENLKPEETAKKVEDFFTEQLKNIAWLKTVEPDTQFIGVGGSFRNLCKIAKLVKRYPLDMVHNYQMSVDDFSNIYNMIKVLDIDKKKKIKGISSGRADILPLAAAAITSLLNYVGVKTITVCGCGLREGLLNYTLIPSTREKPISDVLSFGLSTIAKNYELNIERTQRVVDLAVQLFKQLRVLHKFPRLYLRVLKVAANLYSIGARVKSYNMARHSAYMILNSNLYGISHRELVLAAFSVASSKEEISINELLPYKDLLTEEDVEALKKLGCILRLADNLDRSWTGCVSDVNCDVLGDSVIMKCILKSDASLEMKEATKTAYEFKKAFRKNLEII